MVATLTDALLALTSDRAAAENLPLWVLRGQVLTESGGNPWAIRYEPLYPYLWDVQKDAPWKGTTADGFPAFGGCASIMEYHGQHTSWGLLQIMGAVAREKGFAGIFLSQLCDPGLNLQIGGAYLKELLEWAGGDTFQALGAYNAGRKNALGQTAQAYAARVMQAAKQLETGRV